MPISHRLLLLFALVALAGCVAPVSRHSHIKSGLGFEAGVGALYFHDGTIMKDTSSWWGYRTVESVHAGLCGHGRVGYGFGEKYGVDFSLGIGYGPPLRSGNTWGGWLQAALGGKYRPWKTNHLFFLELGIPKLGVGWVGGFPSKGREKLGVMVETSTALPDSIPKNFSLDALTQLWPPDLLLANAAYNVYQKRGRISPNLGVGLSLSWQPVRIAAKSVIFGLTWSPGRVTK